MPLENEERADGVVRANGSEVHGLPQRISAEWPIEEWRDTHVVLAVSGGADSVALLRGMAALKQECGGAGKVWVAHLNHGLRGRAARADADWLQALCGRLELPIKIAEVDVAALAASQGDGWEAAARTARYDFLRQTAESVGARFVATAHTADDQVETVLHRVIRGTGIGGLGGIPRRRALSASVSLVRPLINVTRNDVLEYLQAVGQDFRTDETNADLRFARNRLRHELLPLLRERFNPDVDAALLRLATQAGEASDLLERLAGEIADTCVELQFTPGANGAAVEPPTGTRISIDCTALSGQPTIVVREVCKAAWRRARWPLQAMGFNEWQLLAVMAAGGATASSLNLPGGVTVIRRDRHLILGIAGLS